MRSLSRDESLQLPPSSYVTLGRVKKKSKSVNFSTLTGGGGGVKTGHILTLKNVFLEGPPIMPLKLKTNPSMKNSTLFFIFFLFLTLQSLTLVERDRRNKIRENYLQIQTS